MAKSTKKVKYALYKYSTENVGDEIQSIAARRFLPRVDYYIDRDRIGEWKNKNQDETVKLIANGWYMRNPFKWPPTDETLDPLLISMYVEPKKVSDGEIPREVFQSNESKEYLKRFGPVGARDKSTLEYFKKNDVDAYFSGCITLTLQRDPNIKKADYILAVDISDKLYEYLLQKTDRKIIRMSPYGDFYLPEQSRFVIAEYFLYLYQSAHAVVTTRLHSVLPSMALETPVILIKDDKNYDPVRYAGLDELTRSAMESEYLNDYELFNLDKPPKNPTKYLKIRKDLIKCCSEYTGFNNDKTFMTIDPEQLINDENFISVFTDSFSKRLSSMINGWKVDELLYKNNELEKEVDKLREYNNLLANNLQKIQDAYDGLVYDYNSIKNTSVKYVVRTIKRKLATSRGRKAK